MEITRVRTMRIIPMTDDYRLLPTYRPAHLLDFLHEVMQVANDTKLAHELRTYPETVSKLRNGHISLSAAILLRMHDATGLPVNNLRDLAGIPNPEFE